MPDISLSGQLTSSLFCDSYSISSRPRPSLKIWSASTIFWNSLGLFRDYGVNYIFYRNNYFIFEIESWNFQHLFEREFRKAHKLSTHSAQSDNCCVNFFDALSDWVELLWGFTKFFLNRCWKFQLSILKKKSFIKKYNSGRSLWIDGEIFNRWRFAVPIFREVFGLSYPGHCCQLIYIMGYFTLDLLALISFKLQHSQLVSLWKTSHCGFEKWYCHF